MELSKTERKMWAAVFGQLGMEFESIRDGTRYDIQDDIFQRMTKIINNHLPVEPNPSCPSSNFMKEDV